MGQINVLDFHVANLIAAGEVVDRPASVVKELLENAIDAGGRAITVEIKRGGVSFIRVSDNGIGMAREDVPVALKRHATSKIKEAEDLDRIETLGFRGEALAAISSVSQIRIMTKREGDATGTLLCASGGRVTEIADAGCPTGTTVIVENLFFNTPARLKFLKKDGTEAANVSAYVEKIALSHPEISFRFISDGETKYATSGDGKRKNVIYTVLGRDFARKILEVQGGFDGVEISGYIGTPDNVRGNRNQQIFYINDRFVRSKTVSAALEQAFATYIPGEKFPCAVLYIDMNTAMVDVNVHPAKLEVKFSNERLVFESVYYTVRGALERDLKRPELQLPADAARRVEILQTVNAFTAGKEGRGGEGTVNTANRTVWAAADDPAEKARRAEYVKLFEDKEGAFPDISEYGFKNEKGQLPPSLNIGATAELPMSVPGHIRTEFARRPVGIPPAETTVSEQRTVSKALSRDCISVQTTVSAETDTPQTETVVSDEPSHPETKETPMTEYRMIGEVFRSYVILENADAMYLIDKHAAHERILFEEFKAVGRATQTERPLQLLLVPYAVALSLDEIETVREFCAELGDAGFIFDIGEHEVRLLQIPSFLDTAAAVDAFCEAVTHLSENSGTASITREQRYEKALFVASCKAAIKAGRDYDPAHLKWVCDRVMNDPAIRYCPHGRPVCFEMTKAAIESRFGRT